MTLSGKYLLVVVCAFIALIAANVYQYNNPRVHVVEVPGRAVIDRGVWVQRTEYEAQKQIIRRLEQENSALARKVRQTGDAIASYTAINGRLKVQLDSLQQERDAWHGIPDPADGTGITESFLTKARQQYLAGIDTTFTTQRGFGNGLFLVTGHVHFRNGQFRQQLELEQSRNIRLNVVNTMNHEQTRVLTYVHSPDFESLEYRSYTELRPPKRRLPWFWIGLGTGVIGTAIIIN